MTEVSIEHPSGVTILAVLEFITGIFYIIAAIGLFTLAAISAIGVIVFLLMGFIALGIGWGLWKLKKWAYQVAMILAILGILTNLLTLPVGIIGIIISVIIIYYLTRPEIKEVFGVTGFLA